CWGTSPKSISRKVLSERSHGIDRFKSRTMNLLITGASGFLGRNVLLRAPKDWRVVAVYGKDGSFLRFVESLNHSGITPVQCDLTRAEEVRDVLARYGEFSSCLYLAAKVDIAWSVREPRCDLHANTVALLNVLEPLRAGHLVYFSSGAVYD